jgi:iron complex outermembrane receptor protein
MSRKSRRNVLKNAAKAERAPALQRLPYSTLGLSSLALGSMAIAGVVHAREAAVNGAKTDSVKPKAAPSAAQAKSLRRKTVRVASGYSIPANGAGLLAQTSPPADQGSSSSSGSTVPAPQMPTGGSGNQLQEIVVTGIRGSLQRAMQIKRMSMGVVDAISAEDIGHFPSSNIGDAVARIPGVTVNRGSLSYASSAGAPTSTGQVQGVNIQGFGGSFNTVLIEGRPIASGNGQTFNFGDFSANYVGEIDVLKTPDFSLSSGNIGGTVNVKFPNPFDTPGMHTKAFLQEDVKTMDGGFRPSFGALWTDTFDNGKFGILVDGDYLDDHTTAHHQDIVGWKGNTSFPCAQLAANYTTHFGSTGCGAVGTGATGNAAVPVWYPQDMAMYLERTDSRRKDARVSLQWHPTENVLVTLDDNYSSDDEHDTRWQRSTWFGSFPGATLDSNGTITNFNYTGPTDFNSFVADQYIVTNTPGINVQWDINDDWSAELDADQSVSKFNPNGGYTDIDADVGYGDNLNQYTGGLALNNNSNVLPYWTAVGPNAVASGSSAVISPNYNGLNPYIIGSHVLPLQTQENTDQINNAKIDATWHRDSTRVKFGAQFTDDDWNTKEMDTFTNNYWELWSGYGPASGNTSGVPLPSSLFTQASLGTWMPGYSGQGNLPSSLLLYSPYSVLNYLINQPVNADQNATAVKDGYPAYVNGVYPAEALSPGSVQHVSRQDIAPFITALQNVPIGSMTLKVGVGLRWQKTDETIAGLASPLTGMIWSGAGDPTAYSFVLGPQTWTTKDNSYSYLLPSLDLKLLMTHDFDLRFDYSKTESPPPDGQIIPNTSYGGRVNALGATGNNPNLMPYLSNNFDLGAEWYYGANDYVTANVFVKDVKNFPTSSIKDITVPGVIDPAPAINPATGGALSNTSGQPAVFAESTVTNALSATVHGVEVIWQQSLPYGFGFQINATYAHSNANFNNYSTTSNQFALTGIGNSANLLLFYQRHGLQLTMATQWQGTQLLLLGQEQGGAAFGNEPVYQSPSTELDFSAQYDFTHYLQGYFEALNLTDETMHTYGRFSNQTLNLINYGREFQTGVRLSF